jgi:wobble nucleotide-excising tRNase
MLQSILVAGQATYSAAGASLGPCKNINFIFGTNGSGKTTISRVIADPVAHPQCQLTWVDGREVERLVYNSDFVERNFTSTLRGIFTLGEESAETIVKIEAAKDKQHEHQAALSSLESNLKGSDGTAGKLGDLKKLRRAFEDACWTIKNRHDAHFQDVFEGLRAAKAKFCDKVLIEQASNTATLCEFDDLTTRAKSVFQKGLARLNPLPLPVFTGLVQLEQSTILVKKVVGKEDVNVSALITRLGNSDWVKQGRAYLDQSGNACPFCQQQVLSDLARDLDDYFDESYAKDLAAINSLQTAYEGYSSAVLKGLHDIAATGSTHLSVEELRADIDRLAQRIELNKRHIARKKNEPSASIVLEELADIAAAIIERLKAANYQIIRHNQLVDNISAERKKLTAEAWRFILHVSKAEIERYLSEKGSLDRAVAGITTAIEGRKAQLAAVTNEIATLERSITSVQPTVNEINGILSSFGFSSFKLATAGERGSFYKLIRHDGSDALKTLSEGERSFITFLYFYHLIRGSVSASGMTADRIIVFDDPVSSLDSDVLFIVSSLIKRVLEDACAGNGQVKQVFVLTHNIYFHKEVSFDPKRGAECRAHETFWIVRKQDDVSTLTVYNHNPIKTSYELLWSEVRSANRSNLTIQNTLRRILESYFKLLGNMDRDEIVAKFDGREKQICASLFSWVNDGSHAAHDDLYVSADNSVVERYLSVFEKIFEKTNHMGHYNMMMGPAPEAAAGSGNLASIAPAVA